MIDDDALSEVARNGWCLLRQPGFLRGRDYDAEEVLRSAHRFGVPSERDGGVAVWPVTPRSSDERATFSVRAGPAELHTDAQYHDRPEDLVALYCVRPASDGGASVVLDFTAAIRALRRSPRTRLVESHLRSPIWRFRVPEQFGTGTNSTGVPVIEGETIRWRRNNLAWVEPGESVARTVADEVSQLLEQSPERRILDLGPGHVLLIDNRRTLHGRTAFCDVDRLLLRVRLWRRQPS